jgi:hypothetical protein
VDEEASRGRRITIAVGAIVILADAEYAAHSIVAKAADRNVVFSQARGVVLLGAVLYWFYQGSRVAKGLLVVLLGLSGLGELLMSFYDPDSGAVVIPGSPDPAVALLGVVMLTCAGILLLSRSVNSFLSHQRVRGRGGA